MQDIERQANKNDVTLMNSGKCQFCGSDTKGGVYECFDIFNNSLNLVEFNSLQQFLIVDMHCLQHPEVHGRWNNHYHLTRLYLILKRNIKWDYKKTALLSNILGLYIEHRKDEVIIPETPLLRGRITITDLTCVEIKEEFNDLLKKCAEEVYDSYNKYHNVAMAVGDNYIKKYES